MKIHKQSMIIGVCLLGIIGCGGDNNKKIFIQNEPKNEPKNALTMIQKCDTKTFTILKKTNIVTILSDNTELDIRHSQDSSKKVCVLTGSARID
ncbi:MAG: hypothetical protein L3J43_03565 [Sulfurovum sp.]|nr:hypothetical protein [Sulfurovum sp.]